MLIALFGILNIFTFGTKTDSLSSTYKTIFAQKLDSLQNTKPLEAGFLGVSVRNCKTNEEVINFNGNKILKPASTLKLVTTATALGILGENFRYETNLEYSGTIKNDTLFGNIIIKGSGDPTLGSWRFDETLDYSRLVLDWANKINALNIKAIKGNVLANTSVFSDNSVPETWQWGDMGNYFGAAAFGLNINENLFKGHFKTGKINNSNSELFQTEPSLPDYDINNEVKADKETHNDDVLFFSTPFSNFISAKGKLPINKPNFVVKGSIPNPPDLVTHLLKNTLGKLNIAVLNNEKFYDTQPTLITKVKSPSLFEICMATNFESINLYAEALLKTISSHKNGIGSTEGGINNLKKYWQDKLLTIKGLYMKDGSGLSVANGIAPNTMTNILSGATNDKTFTAFHQSIAVLGQEGTVKNIGKNKDFAENFSVKTGTIEKVKAYAGYFKNIKGQLMSFSIMANQFEGSSSAMGRQLTRLFEEMYLLE